MRYVKLKYPAIIIICYPEDDPGYFVSLKAGVLKDTPNQNLATRFIWKNNLDDCLTSLKRKDINPIICYLK